MGPAELTIAAVIPALDEEACIAGVVGEILSVPGPAGHLVGEVVVADNGSRDRTAEVARAAGATVVPAHVRGYGSACLAGLAYLARRPAGPPDVVVFVDGDGSNDLGDLSALLAPIRAGEAELVIGARGRLADPGSLTLPQKFGNRLATVLLRHLYGAPFTDLGPFRAVTWSALQRLAMEDPNYGWTVEMQLKAAKLGLRATEVEVHNRARRAGRSKVAGTVRGVAGAGYKIVWTLLRYR